MKLRIWTFDLPLTHTFRISRGSVSVQSTLIVEIEHDGVCGYGEATTSRYYSQTIDGMSSVVRLIKEKVEAFKPNLADCEWPAKMWATFDGELGVSRFAQCAVDEAIWDLFWETKRRAALCDVGRRSYEGAAFGLHNWNRLHRV